MLIKPKDDEDVTSDMKRAADATTYRARVTSKGQVTVPIVVREALGLRTGDDIIFKQTPNGYVVTKAVQASPFRRYVGHLSADRKHGTDALVDELRGPGPDKFQGDGGESHTEQDTGEPPRD